MRSRAVSLPRERWRSTASLAAAAGDVGGALAQLRDERGHAFVRREELVGAALDLRGEDGHVRSLSRLPDASD